MIIPYKRFIIRLLIQSLFFIAILGFTHTYFLSEYTFPHIVINERVEYRHPAQELVWRTDELDNYRINDKDKICLAKNIFYEARGESIVGQIAVAQVTINRLIDGRWGRNICSVVYANGQFSWTENKQARSTIPGRLPLKGDQWDIALNIADLVLKGLRMPMLDQALWYHNIFVTPQWGTVAGDNMVGRVGQHIFYKQIFITIKQPITM